MSARDESRAAARTVLRGATPPRPTLPTRATPSLEAGVLNGPALRSRQRHILRLRRAVQLGSLALVVAIGAQFVVWVRGLEAGRIVGERPPGVEGFLPIAALMSLRHLLLTGEVHPVHPAGLVLFLLILATGLLLKKAFCSWLCPVGTPVEWLARLSERVFGRRLGLPRFVDVPLRGLKYLLLLFFAWAVFFQMSPAMLEAFLDSPYSRMADVKMLYFFERLSPFGWQVLGGLVGISFVIPYFWCRYLCPYGALLGLASLVSPLKLTRHAPSCIDCSLCTKACPARLPVERLSRVRSDECFGCLSCVAACPVPRALRVEAPRPLRTAVQPAAFAALVLALFVGGIAAARLAGIWRSEVSAAEYLARIHELDRPAYGHPGAAGVAAAR